MAKAHFCDRYLTQLKSLHVQFLMNIISEGEILVLSLQGQIVQDSGGFLSIKYMIKSKLKLKWTGFTGT